MRIVFKDYKTMVEECVWLVKDEDSGHWYNTTQFGEKIEVNPNTREIVTGHGYENYIAGLLKEGKVRIR